MPHHWLDEHALFLLPLGDQAEYLYQHKLLPSHQLLNAVEANSDYQSVHRLDQTQRKFREKV
jgi:hypothetical protein